MLTVKILSPGGTEQIIEATEVTYTPARYTPDQAPAVLEAPAAVWIKPPQSQDAADIVQMVRGTVYVMGASGATMSAYYLGDPENPAD